MQHLNLALEMKRKRCLESTLAIFNPKHLWRCVSKTRYHFGDTTNDELAAIDSANRSYDNFKRIRPCPTSHPGLQGVMWNRHLGDFVTWDVRNPPFLIQKDLMYHDTLGRFKRSFSLPSSEAIRPKLRSTFGFNHLIFAWRK